MIPLLALLTMIASSFSIPLTSITSFINDNFPTAVGNLLLPLLNGKCFDLSMLIFLFTAFWLASGGAVSIITASDVIYNIEPQKFIPKRIKAFIMTIVLIMLIMFMFIVPVFGDLIFKFITSLSFYENFSIELLILYYLLKYPLSFFLIYFCLKLIYTIALNKNVKSKSVTSGSIFTTITWMLITQFYSWWVSNVMDYNLYYGSISSILILLLWMYFLAYAFTVGLVMNAEATGVVEELNEKNK